MAADGSSPCPRASLKRKPSYRALGDVPDQPAAGGSAVWFVCAPAAGQDTVVEGTLGHHFLDACSLCKLPLRRSQDVYMCRGNVPFCSEECREEWMEVEETREAEERSCHRSISSRAAAATSTQKEQDGEKAVSPFFHARASEAVAAS
ncbi:hypothetical protein Taro_030991 [Colocasia esculenta]|uniref:FLZ-type domain-containing protein n=1 Tax=Colocasia esculenta TaxID=4460 RepID=A0A843VNU4_COLES|nr:hypothetical protein [Colocasia esculenta]